MAFYTSFAEYFIRDYLMYKPRMREGKEEIGLKVMESLG